jgi:hypothetical protein
MAEMIATYSGPGAGTGAATATSSGATVKEPAAVPAGSGSGYLNEVSPLTARPVDG